jgi:hypothetical protein
MFVKVYSKEPVHLGAPSTDESLYKFESYVDPDDFTGSDIPGGNYSSEFTLRVNLNGGLSPGQYPILMKVYYGKEKVAQTEFAADVRGSN